MSDKLTEIKDFLNENEGYDKSEVIRDILGKFMVLKGYAADEIALMWDEEYLIDLDSFAHDFWDEMISAVTNVIDSFNETKEDTPQ